MTDLEDDDAWAYSGDAFNSEPHPVLALMDADEIRRRLPKFAPDALRDDPDPAGANP